MLQLVKTEEKIFENFFQQAKIMLFWILFWHLSGKVAKHHHVSIQTPKLHISPARISKINFFGGYKSTGHPVYDLVNKILFLE